jgi:ferrous iron transport protein B
MKTIALLGQPNSGKSTLFNGLTGSHQHVGNWPGKTVEKKEGTFTYEKEDYTIVDLPGTYSLSANSDEEIITRDYIADGEADLVCVLADASQLERSLFMLTDFIGLNVPAILILNLMDVAESLGKKIDVKTIEEKLGIPVIPFVAADKSYYPNLLKALKKALTDKKKLDINLFESYYANDTNIPYYGVKELVSECQSEFRSDYWLAIKCIENDKNILSYCKSCLSKENYAALSSLINDIKRGNLYTGNCKFAIIHGLIKSSVNAKASKPVLSRFDRIATSRIWGKPLAIGIMLLAFVFAMIIASPIMAISSAIPSLIQKPLYDLLSGIGVSAMLTSLISQLLPNILSFAISMCGFVMGVTFIFALIEEVGYMARIAFVFDSLMAKLGLQGKSVCAFLMGFGCTIGGAAGTRVIDN